MKERERLLGSMKPDRLPMSTQHVFILSSLDIKREKKKEEILPKSMY